MMNGAIAPTQRHTRSHRCQVCDGADGDPRGKSKRCSGFVSSDGEYVHCSRDELAGGIDANGAGLFAHKMHGPCKCGTTHGADRLPSSGTTSRIVATYDYRDERGVLLFQVVRKDPKSFPQRRPDGAGGWIWKLDDTRRVLYRLPDLLSDDADRTVYIVEGEKDADTLTAKGFLATCNPGGAADLKANTSKWSRVADHAREVLRDRDVVIVADRDEVGRKHALEVFDALRGVTRSLVTLTPPAPFKDATDLIEAGRSLTELVPVDVAEPSTTEAPPPWAKRVAPCEAAWFTETPPRRTWLLRDARFDDAGVLPAGKVGMLLATSGIGKTMVGCQLALSVASAEPVPFLGCYSVPDAGRVLLVLGEEDAAEVTRRLYNARRSLGAPVPEPGSIVALPLAGVACALLEADGRGNLTETTFLAWLRAFVREEGPFALIVIDPLSRFAGLDAEKDNAAGTRVVQAAESIAADTDAVVLLVHHTNKASRVGGAVTAEAARGSSAFVDGVRWAAALHAERVDGENGLDELVTFTVVKSNYSRKGAPVTLRRDLDNGGALVPLSEAEREMANRAREASDPSARRREAREEDRRQREERQAATVAARQAEEVARLEDEDRTLDAILTERPDITQRDLRAAMATRCAAGCGHTRVDRAQERRRARLGDQPQPAGGV